MKTVNSKQGEQDRCSVDWFEVCKQLNESARSRVSIQVIRTIEV